MNPGLLGKGKSLHQIFPTPSFIYIITHPHSSLTGFLSYLLNPQRAVGVEGISNLWVGLWGCVRWSSPTCPTPDTIVPLQPQLEFNTISIRCLSPVLLLMEEAESTCSLQLYQSHEESSTMGKYAVFRHRQIQATAPKAQLRTRSKAYSILLIVLLQAWLYLSSAWCLVMSRWVWLAHFHLWNNKFRPWAKSGSPALIQNRYKSGHSHDTAWGI